MNACGQHNMSANWFSGCQLKLKISTPSTQALVVEQERLWTFSDKVIKKFQSRRGPDALRYILAQRKTRCA
jgi:hypothetical protein